MDQSGYIQLIFNWYLSREAFPYLQSRDTQRGVKNSFLTEKHQSNSFNVSLIANTEQWLKLQQPIKKNQEAEETNSI